MSHDRVCSPAVAWHDAWSESNHRFYRSQPAEDHFATSVEVDERIAAALADIVTKLRATREKEEFLVIDIGSGSGRLLEQLRARIAGPVSFLGIDVRPRPSLLPREILWRQMRIDEGSIDITGNGESAFGLVIAHEFLDDVPCDIVEIDDDMRARIVLVDPVTGAEELGPCLDDPAARRIVEPRAPDSLQQWMTTWWPLTRPGARREIGLTRDLVWSRITKTLHSGAAVAIDYAHSRADRTLGVWDGGTLKGFASGRARRPVPDGSVNLTAHVALDALATPRAQLTTQAQVIGDSSLTSWPLGLGSYTWLIEPIGQPIDAAPSSASHGTMSR